MSSWTGATEGLQQVLAARELRKRQMLLDTLQVRDKQQNWDAEKVRQAQTDRQLSQVEKNQAMLRQQAEQAQANIEKERKFRRASTVATNMVKGKVDATTAGLLDDEGFGGMVDKHPGLAMEMQRTPQAPTAPGDIPLLPVSMGRNLQVTPDEFSTEGGTNYQMARQAAIERAQQAAATQAGINARQEDQQEFTRGIKEMTIGAARDRAQEARDAKDALKGPNGMTPQQERQYIHQQTTTWDKNAQAVMEVQRQVGMINAAVSRMKQDPNGAGIIIINAFSKMIDPQSVVREGEYARIAQGQSLMNYWRGKMDQYKKGGAGLTDAQLMELVATANAMSKGYEGATSSLRDRTVLNLDHNMIDPRLVIPGYQRPSETTGNVGPAAPPAGPAKPLDNAALDALIAGARGGKK